MKKIIYILPVLTLFVLLTNTSFAFNYYTDNGAIYSNEQFRRDVKSYLDTQLQRQENQDLINNLYNNYSNHKSQFELEQFQQKIEEANQREVELSNQIKEVQEVINQQRSNAEKEDIVYKNTNAFCIELKSEYQTEGVIEELANSCLKYGVFIKTRSNNKTIDIVAKKDSENIYTVPHSNWYRKNIIEKDTTKVNTLGLDNASVVSTETLNKSELPLSTSKKQSFFNKIFIKIKSFFGRS